MPSSATTPEQAIDHAIRQFGEALNMFDPLRFRAWAEIGLTTSQLRVLFLVRETPGVTAGELAHRLAVTPPTVSGIVDRLVRLGLMRREDDESDRRLVRNFLTEQGDASCKRMEQGSEAFLRRILVELDRGELEAFTLGIKAFIKASQHVASVEPNLAAVAIPGLSN